MVLIPMQIPGVKLCVKCNVEIHPPKRKICENCRITNRRRDSRDWYRDNRNWALEYARVVATPKHRESRKEKRRLLKESWGYCAFRKNAEIIILEKRLEGFIKHLFNNEVFHASNEYQFFPFDFIVGDNLIDVTFSIHHADMKRKQRLAKALKKDVYVLFVSPKWDRYALVKYCKNRDYAALEDYLSEIKPLVIP